MEQARNGNPPAGGNRRHPRGRRGALLDIAAPGGRVILDPYRAVVFPNRIREQRIRSGQLKLLGFAMALPDIPYIRLSKIERGEVFARADELRRIAGALDLDAADLLIDVEAPGFDIAAWYAPFAESVVLEDENEARGALLLAAALRARRQDDPGLSAGALDARFGIPAVVLSRIENAQKGLARWNEQTVASLCRVFDVADEAALRAHLDALHRSGALDPHLAGIATPEQREHRTRQRIAALRGDLGSATARPGAAQAFATPRLVPVFGAPLADGLVAMTPTGTHVEAPAIAGGRAFGLRIGRATLGAGLPGQATVIVDPDRYPVAGGLALVRDGGGHRVVAVALDRGGAMIGYSLTPDREIAIDALPAGAVAAIVAAVFV